MNNPDGGRPQTEYVLSINMAKELSMVENTGRGRQARLYFIECEKRLRQVMPRTFAEALRLAADQQEKIEAQQKLLEQQAPKAKYFDDLVERKLNLNFRDTAKEIGIKQNDFIKLLLEKQYIYRDKKGRIKPYAELTGSLFTIKECTSGDKWAGNQTLITPKGRETFNILFGKER